MLGKGPRRRPAARDEEVVRALFAEHGGAVLAYATKLTGDYATAEDVLQETLIRAWRKPDLLADGRGSVRAWMFTVAHNLVVDRARARAVRPTEVREHPGAEPLTDDHADRVATTAAVLNALDTFSTEHRELLVEPFYRCRTVQEAATQLGVPPGTVKSRTYYAHPRRGRDRGGAAAAADGGGRRHHRSHRS
jgi:RNA polymerase sigma-70 factor (ECF subfamily)